MAIYDNRVRRAALPAGAPREAMEASVARHAAKDDGAMGRRIEELRRSLGTRRMLDAEEWCALKALRGDFGGEGAAAGREDRLALDAYEDDGGPAARPGEEEACNRRERLAVLAALDAARRGA